MLEFKVITDLETARQLWNELSPGESIFDLWDFRYCFYKHDPYPLYFIAAYESQSNSDANLVGLMPLDRHPKFGYEFLAEDPCEESRPFVRPGREDLIPQLYELVPAPAKFFDITGDDPFTIKLPLEDYKYILPLKSINNFSDFLETRLSAKRRRSFVKEIEALKAQGVTAKISPQSELDLELLFDFNLTNFSEESYLREHERAPWRDLIKLPLDWRLVVLEIAGRKQAVSLSALYNGEWHYLITGVNFKEFPGLGKYLTMVNLEMALASGAKIFDAGLGDCGWKKLWHFDEKPQYEFIK